MKKIHIALLVVAVITAVSSVYSLAAINQVYSIEFQWYSTFNKAFTEDLRDLSRDEWELENQPSELKIGITARGNIDSGIIEEINNADFVQDNSNIYIWASMGVESSPEYSVKFSSIAQRGDVVEVVVSLNSPSKVWDKEKELTTEYRPFDLIKISKASLSTRGKMLFIFKDQAGNQIHSEYIYI